LLAAAVAVCPGGRGSDRATRGPGSAGGETDVAAASRRASSLERIASDPRTDLRTARESEREARELRRRIDGALEDALHGAEAALASGRPDGLRSAIERLEPLARAVSGPRGEEARRLLRALASRLDPLAR
jgi:hypothetical protein